MATFQTLVLFLVYQLDFVLLIFLDAERSQPLSQEGLPKGGGAADQPAARPHC